MANINLFGKDWTNIVFEGRNKAYGAYKLRQENPKTTLLALLLGIVCIGLAFGGSVAYKSVFGEKFSSTKDVEEVSVTEIELPELPEPEPPVEEIEEEPIPEPEPEPEPADASKSVQEEVKFLETEVKKDNEVKNEQKTTQKDIDDTKTSGREDREADKDGDFKSKGEQTGGADKGSKGTGTGNKFAEEDTNKIHNFVQKKAEPNEGFQNFYKSFQRKFNSPDVGGNVSEISVRLKFVVERDGSLTDIKVTGSDPHNIGKEAIRVLKSMPNWKPGQHNGKTVRSSFTLPIKMRVN